MHRLGCYSLWKIKANLADLIDEKNDTARILRDLNTLGNNGFPFLSSLGYYIYDLDEPEYCAYSDAELSANIKEGSRKLLIELERQEKSNPDFKIADFKEVESVMEKDDRKWWEFWK